MSGTPERSTNLSPLHICMTLGVSLCLFVFLSLYSVKKFRPPQTGLSFIMELPRPYNGYLRPAVYAHRIIVPAIRQFEYSRQKNAAPLGDPERSGIFVVVLLYVV